jgi:threonine synthase
VVPVRPNTRAHSLAIGNPADGDLAVATARTSGGAIYAVPEDEIGENISLLAETAGVFGETAPAVTVGALRKAAGSGAIGAGDRVVVLVTATGLKTPQAVEARSAVIEVDADADAILARTRVAA